MRGKLDGLTSAGEVDARAKLVGALAAIVIVSSTPPGSLLPFAMYFLLIFVAGNVSGIRAATMLSRIAAGAIFLLIAAALVAVADAGWRVAASLLLKGSAAIAILTLLTETTEIASILWAMRKLGAPRAVTLISAMMLRFVWMLFEEFARMSRARASRCGRPLAGELLFRVHGSQAGLLLIRSWERADRIYNGMLARGFAGDIPETRSGNFGVREVVFLIGAIGLFLAARYFLSSGTSVVLFASMVTSRLTGNASLSILNR